VVAVTDASTHFACPVMDGQAELGQVAWMNILRQYAVNGHPYQH